MPLRDHFRPPVENEHSWDELHGMWPAVIVQQLFPLLPEGYIAAPRVHLGAAFEIDVSTFERDEPVQGAGRATEAPVSPSRRGRRRNRPSRWKQNFPTKTSMKYGSTMRVMVGGWSRRSKSSALPTRIVPRAGGHSSPRSPRCFSATSVSRLWTS